VHPNPPPGGQSARSGLPAAGAQHRLGSLALMPGHISGVLGAGVAAVPGVTTVPGGTTTVEPGVTTTALPRGLAAGYSTSSGHAVARLR
jgi:hypothetical protein